MKRRVAFWGELSGHAIGQRPRNVANVNSNFSHAPNNFTLDRKVFSDISLFRFYFQFANLELQLEELGKRKNTATLCLEFNN